MQVTVARAGRFHTISPRSGPLRCRTPISRPFSTRNRTTPCIEPISANSVKTSRTKDHRHERPCPPGTVRGARLRAVWFVDAFWRDHAEAEDRVKAVKRVGLGLLPSKSRQLNAARVPAATIAADLDAWNRLLLLHDEPELAAAEPETISGKVGVDGLFLDVAGRDELGARVPGAGDAVRKAAHIAPAERQLALYELAAECPGMSQDELVRHTGEFFGWRRMGRDIRAFLDSDTDELLGQGRLKEADGQITAVG